MAKESKIGYEVAHDRRESCNPYIHSQRIIISAEGIVAVENNSLHLGEDTSLYNAIVNILGYHRERDRKISL